MPHNTYLPVRFSVAKADAPTPPPHAAVLLFCSGVPVPKTQKQSSDEHINCQLLRERSQQVKCAERRLTATASDVGYKVLRSATRANIRRQP